MPLPPPARVHPGQADPGNGGSRHGTVAEGKWADLVILDADPLEDIRNTRKICKVMQGGRLVDREAILEWARKNQTAGDLP